MIIDTHCHLDAAEFDHDRDHVIERARQAGLRAIVIPAVERANFAAVRELAHAFEGGAYALGIHPICAPHATDEDLQALESCIQAALDDSRFVAIGEIGLDYFVPELRQPAARSRQEAIYCAQLDMAVRYGLPVLVHVRRAQDMVLKHLRKRPSITGIAHAFNGSFQQADEFIRRGFALGFGGAMTFDRALRIRRLASESPEAALVLETDAPDIAPEWLAHPAVHTGPGSTPAPEPRDRRPAPRNEPAELARIGAVLAELRAIPPEQVARLTTANACRIMPRLGRLLGAAPH